jgi:hypothetical protein
MTCSGADKTQGDKLIDHEEIYHGPGEPMRQDLVLRVCRFGLAAIPSPESRFLHK